MREGELAKEQLKKALEEWKESGTWDGLTTEQRNGAVIGFEAGYQTAKEEAFLAVITALKRGIGQQDKR